MIIGALNLTHEAFHTIIAPTLISAVSCDGSELSLSDCQYSSATECGPLSDAGVIGHGQ